MDEKMPMIIILTLWAIGILIPLGISGLLIYAVIHFVQKYW